MYGKVIAQAIATILAGLVPFLVDGALSPLEWTNVGLLVLSTILVGVVPNLTGTTAKYAKGITAAGIAVFTLLSTFVALGTHLGSSEIIQLVLAGLGAVGVIGLPSPKYPATTLQRAG